MPLKNNHHHHHHNDKSHQSISFFETSFADEGGAFLSAPEERVDDSMAWEPWPTEQQQPKKTHKATKKQQPQPQQEQQSFGNSSFGGGPPRARSSPSRNSSSTNHHHQHQVVAPDDSLWGNASGFDSMLLPPPSTASTTPIKQRNMDFDSSAHDWFAVPSGTAGTKQPQPPPSSSSSSSKGPAPSAFLQEQQRLADSKSQDWGIRPGVSGDEEFGTADAQWHTNPNLSLSQSSDHNLEDSHEPSPQQQQPQGRDATSSSNVWDPHQAPDFSLATTTNNSKNNNSNSSGRRGSLGRKQGRSKRDMDSVVMVVETSSSSPRRLSASPSKSSKNSNHNSKGVSPSSASATTPTSQSSSSKGKGFMGRFFGVRLVGSSLSVMCVSCTSTDPSVNSRYFWLVLSSSLFL